MKNIRRNFVEMLRSLIGSFIRYIWTTGSVSSLATDNLECEENRLWQQSEREFVLRASRKLPRRENDKQNLRPERKSHFSKKFQKKVGGRETEGGGFTKETREMEKARIALIKRKMDLEAKRAMKKEEASLIKEQKPIKKEKRAIDKEMKALAKKKEKFAKKEVERLKTEKEKFMKRKKVHNRARKAFDGAEAFPFGRSVHPGQEERFVSEEWPIRKAKKNLAKSEKRRTAHAINKNSLEKEEMYCKKAKRAFKKGKDSVKQIKKARKEEKAFLKKEQKALEKEERAIEKEEISIKEAKRAMKKEEAFLKKSKKILEKNSRALKKELKASLKRKEALSKRRNAVLKRKEKYAKKDEKLKKEEEKLRKEKESYNRIRKALDEAEGLLVGRELLSDERRALRKHQDDLRKKVEDLVLEQRAIEKDKENFAREVNKYLKDDEEPRLDTQAFVEMSEPLIFKPVAKEKLNYILSDYRRQWERMSGEKEELERLKRSLGRKREYIKREREILDKKKRLLERRKDDHSIRASWYAHAKVNYDIDRRALDQEYEIIAQDRVDFDKEMEERVEEYTKRVESLRKKKERFNKEKEKFHQDRKQFRIGKEAVEKARQSPARERENLEKDKEDLGKQKRGFDGEGQSQNKQEKNISENIEAKRLPLGETKEEFKRPMNSYLEQRKAGREKDHQMEKEARAQEPKGKQTIVRSKTDQALEDMKQVMLSRFNEMMERWELELLEDIKLGCKTR
ncbi:calponin homology domain-containing protein DDB_G0272472-like [Macrobrachium rosenbergii]|uniref:calponin homology domain-containing protein DDB_G0272472-like n=1 Tax=Macrobrachium rosenbergii TaxID=79674 RepID=UPI0034D7142E